MDTPEKNISIESADQEHTPETNRFLNSLGFGETVLQDLRDSDREGGSPSIDNSEEEENPAVMLSSQVDDLDLPGVDTFSEITHIRRGGLQDIVRRQPSDSKTDLPIEKTDVSKSAQIEGKLISSDLVKEEIKIAAPEKVEAPEEVSASEEDEALEDVLAPEKVEISENVSASEEVKETKFTATEVTELENVETEEIPFPEAILQRAPSQIISVIVNGREIRNKKTANTDTPEKVIDETEIQEETIVADIAILSDERIEVGNEEIAGEEDFTDSESSDSVVLSCPKCEGELALQKEHLGVEGNCVWCGVPILAAESGADGKIRVFVIESEKPSELEAQQEITIYEKEISDPFDAKTEEQTPQLPPLELPESEVSPEDAPGTPLFESHDEAPLEQAFEKEQPPKIEEAKPIAENFSPLSEGAGFADLPSAPVSFEKEEAIVDTVDSAVPLEIPADNTQGKLSSPKEESSELKAKESEIESPNSPDPQPELPSASTFDQLGKDAAWAEPFPESPKVNDSELEKFPFLDAKSNSGVNESSSLSPEASTSFANPKPEKKEESKHTETFPSGEGATKLVESPKELRPSSEPFPKNEESSSPFPDVEPNSAPAKLTYDAKLKIPDDVLSFLGSIESDNAESPEKTKKLEAVTGEPEAAPAPETEQQENTVEEVAPLSKKEQRKERRAKRKEASLKRSSEQAGPLPAPGAFPAKSGSKMKPKTKVGIISIAVLVAGLGIASYFVPVQEYVDKAHLFMSEAFNEQIGLDPNWKPPVVKEVDSKP